MKCLRIYATPDGESHFDEIELPTTPISVHPDAVPFDVTASYPASRVRITHIPTGIMVVQAEKSQHQNRARAMQILRARLYDMERQKAESERSESRRSQVGSGDRSERIRTYNFPQGRVTDHRINLTLYKLDRVMEGDLDELIDALISDHQTALLAEMGGEA